MRAAAGRLADRQGWSTLAYRQLPHLRALKSNASVERATGTSRPRSRRDRSAPGGGTTPRKREGEGMLTERGSLRQALESRGRFPRSGEQTAWTHRVYSAQTRLDAVLRVKPLCQSQGAPGEETDITGTAAGSGERPPTGRPARWSAGPLGLTSEKTRVTGADGILPLTRQRGRHSGRHAGRTERGSLRWSCPSRRGVSGRQDRRPRLWWQQPTPGATASEPRHSVLPSWACLLPGDAHRRA